MTSVINSFRGKYRFLSNFHTSLFTYEHPTLGEFVVPSAEHAFQAAKTDDHSQAIRILHAAIPGTAKSLGRKVTLRADWEEKKLDIMEGILMAKFHGWQLQRQLLNTGDAELVEVNDWNDTFWGVCIRTEQGENNLGRLLMKVRAHYKGCQFNDRKKNF